MAKYIEREAAKEAVVKAVGKGHSPFNAIVMLPAADVRPVARGKWISNDDGETIIKLKHGEPQGSCFCSVCHEWLVASDEYDVKGNFCPSCGAKMEES